MRLDNFTQFQINLTNVDETLMRFNVRLGRFRTSLRRARNDSATRHRACNFIILSMQNQGTKKCKKEEWSSHFSEIN